MNEIGVIKSNVNENNENNNKNIEVQKFMQIVGSTQDVATYYLNKNKNNVQDSVNDYFNNQNNSNVNNQFNNMNNNTNQQVKLQGYVNEPDFRLIQTNQTLIIVKVNIKQLISNLQKT